MPNRRCRTAHPGYVHARAPVCIHASGHKCTPTNNQEPCPSPSPGAATWIRTCQSHIVIRSPNTGALSTQQITHTTRPAPRMGNIGKQDTADPHTISQTNLLTARSTRPSAQLAPLRSIRSSQAIAATRPRAPIPVPLTATPGIQARRHATIVARGSTPPQCVTAPPNCC